MEEISEENLVRARLQELLDQRKWSQRKLAGLSGVSKSQINAYLDGKSNDMTLAYWVKVARALGFSLDWLTGLPRREKDSLMPDEEDLLQAYRQITDDLMRSFILNNAKDAAKKASKK